MTDLQQMMDSVTLTECRKEIEQQLASIETHDNSMKRAVLLCFLGEAVLARINKEDADKFIDELKAYLNKVANGNTENGKRLMAHVKENGDIVRNIDTISDELRKLSTEIEGLMAEYDARLSEVVRTRDNLPIGKL